MVNGDHHPDVILGIAMGKEGLFPADVEDYSIRPNPALACYTVRLQVSATDFRTVIVEYASVANAVAQPVTAPTVDGTTITVDVGAR